MPPRRWSERDTDALRQLFEELMFDTRVYTDSTHDLSSQVGLSRLINSNYSDLHFPPIELNSDNKRVFEE